MDKLTRYNQKLLAIIGTTALAGAGLALIFGIGGHIISLIDFGDANDNGIKIQNQQSGDKDTNEITRTQEISFDSPHQLDTAQAKYVIPVGQVNLQTKEKVQLESNRTFKFSGSGYRYDSYYGLYNNFIYKDYNKDLSKKIFDERVAITYWAFIKQNKIEALLFKGSSVDSNSDNQIDNDDYQSLFVYYLSDNTLLKYTLDHKTILGFEPMSKTDMISVKIGIDKNKDFNFENDHEPQEIMTLNLQSRKLKDAVSPKLKKEIQLTIDGV